MTLEDQPKEKRRGGFARTLSSLRQRDYRMYFISGLGMTAAEGIQLLALAWLVLDLTGSIGQLGIVIFVRGIPSAIISLYGGVFADRYNRRNILLYNQLFTMINLFVLAGLTMSGAVAVWHVYIASMVLGITQSMTMPARQALIRGLVREEDLMNAVSLNAMQQNSARIIWPAMAGGLIGLIGAGGTLVVCGACYIVGIFFLLMIRNLSQGRASTQESAVTQIIEGFRYIAATPLVMTVALMMIALSFFGLAYMQMGPAYGREVLGLSAGMTGLFIMASGVGAITGSTALVSFEVRNRTAMFVAFSGLFGAALLGLAVTPWVAGAFLLMGLFGVSSSGLVILGQTIFQAMVPDRLLGRVMSLWTFTGGISSISALPMGFAADEFGMRGALGFVAVMLIVICVLVTVVRKPWQYSGKLETPSLAPEAASPGTG